jgi:hypothetical protein
MKLPPLKAIDHKVLAILSATHKSILRETLQRKIFGAVSEDFDRAIRRSIKHLRDHNYVIASSSRKPGYRLTTEKDAVKAYVEETRKRAKVMLATARRVERAHGLRKQARMQLSA